MDEVGTALDRHRAGAARRVHSDDLHRRHHRPVLPPVRGDHRHGHGHLAVPVADAQSGAVRAAVPSRTTSTRRSGRAADAPGARLLPPLRQRLRCAGARLRPAGARPGRARGCRCWSATCCCSAFAGWFVQRLPTGFIPSLDRAILIISLQLPPGASLARTDAVVQQATDIVLADARRQIFQRLHRPQRRHLHGRHQRRPAVPRARRFRGAAPPRARPSTRSPRTCAASWRRSRRRSRSCSSRRRCAAWARRPASPCGCRTRSACRRPSSRASRRSSSPRPTARPASPTSSPPSRPRRRRSSSTSTATRRRC